MEEDKKNKNESFIGHEVKSLKDNFIAFISSLYHFLYTTLSFAKDVDVPATVDQIKKDIDFKGLNVWILFFSIIIASIGLNVDSIPVIIGAMLISPLMGPIMGIGLAVGTNDSLTLVRSLKSFGTAVGVSLMASTFYFLVSPFDEASHQLLSRTQPMLFDVFVAIFGGLAGIMAASTSKNKITNVIPGVAIATALMPPLCTAGYGLAHWNMKYFTGAFYLFIINSVYISLATFVVVRYLKFPLKHFIDPVKEKKIKRFITIFAIILVIPSVITLWTSYQENSFKSNIKKFVSTHFDKDYTNVVTDYKTDSISLVYIHTTNNTNNLSEAYLNKQSKNFGLGNVRIILTDQNEKFARIEKELNKMKYGDLGDGSGNMLAEYRNTVNALRNKDMEIMSLLDQIEDLQSDTIPFNNVLKEVKINYPNINKFSYGKVTQFYKDTTVLLPTFIVHWKSKYHENKEKEKVKNWLKIRLNLDTLQLIPY